MRTIYRKGKYRIIEAEDRFSTLADLKGDEFKPRAKINKYFSAEELKRLERRFEKDCKRLGVYLYELQKWNPEIGKGWTKIETGFGFIGQYQKSGLKVEHIVEEFKRRMK